MIIGCDCVYWRDTSLSRFCRKCDGTGVIRNKTESNHDVISELERVSNLLKFLRDKNAAGCNDFLIKETEKVYVKLASKIQ